jgi:hypothetical protein
MLKHNTLFNNLTHEELINTVTRSDNTLAQQLIVSFKGEVTNEVELLEEKLEEYEDQLSDSIAEQLDKSFKTELEEYNNPESDHYEFLYCDGIQYDNDQLKRVIEENEELTETQIEFLIANLVHVVDEVSGNTDYYLKPTISHNYWAPKNAVLSHSIGEIEICTEWHFKEVNFINDTIKRQALDKLDEVCINDNTEYAYYDLSSSVINLVLTNDMALELYESVHELLTEED